MVWNPPRSATFWWLLGKGDRLHQARTTGHPKCWVREGTDPEDGPHRDWEGSQLKTAWLYLLRHLWPGPGNPKFSPDGVARHVTPTGCVSGVRNVESAEMEAQSVAGRPFLETLSEVLPAWSPSMSEIADRCSRSLGWHPSHDCRPTVALSTLAGGMGFTSPPWIRWPSQDHDGARWRPHLTTTNGPDHPPPCTARLGYSLIIGPLWWGADFHKKSRGGWFYLIEFFIFG